MRRGDSRSGVAATQTTLALVGLTIALAWAALRRLQGYPYPHDLRAALAGAAETAHATVPAALLSALVVGAAVAAAAAWLHRRRPDWSALEAVAGGVVLFWAGCYLALLALGPADLYRPLVLRALLAAAIVLAVWRAWAQPRASIGAPAEGLAASVRPRRRRRMPAGAGLAVGAFALTVVPLAILQIASPVSPFMDVLPHVAGPEKIVTFRYYDPYDNDAAGLWAQTRQIAGYDAVFSFIGLVAGLPAKLVMTGLIVPLAALQIAALYLLGRVVHGSFAGGIAALFLLQTFVWRRTPDARGTAIAFTLVAIGLAFLLSRRDDRERVALGGLALGVGFAVNPLIGGAGMQVAAAAVLVRWIDLGRGLVAPVVVLAGATLLAIPQVLLGFQIRFPLWIFAALAFAGTGVLVVMARTRGAPPSPRRRRIAQLAVILGVPTAALVLHARRSSELLGDEWTGYAILTLLGLGGLAVAAHEVWRRPGRWPAIVVPALGLAVALLNHTVASPLRFTGETLELRSLASEVTPKMTLYWWPYWLTLAAGSWLAVVARRSAVVPVVAIVLVLVVYPVRQAREALDYDGAGLSVAETWGFHLANAARGYHAGRGDRRWVLNDDWQALADVLRAEVAAGRLDYHTHVLQLSPGIDSVELALGAGVSVDLITPQYDPMNIWTGNGRARGLDHLGTALAAEPRYLVLQGYEPDAFAELVAALPRYELLAERRGVRLYRLGAERRPRTY